MRALSLMDTDQRDAHVAFAPVTADRQTRHRTQSGNDVSTVKVIKSTYANRLAAIAEKAERAGKEVHDLLVEGDPEIDFDYTGKISTATKTIYVDESGRIAHNVWFQDIIFGPDGEERERKPRESIPANIKTDWPLRWTKKLIPIETAVRRFVFTKIYQLRHVNGLTFDFLYQMADRLEEKNAVVMIGAGPDGKEPLRFSRGGLPYRAFLRGRTMGEGYLLTMHLSQLELKAVVS